MNLGLSMRIRDCYRTLKIPQGASWEEIKRAYRSLARRYHPDLHLGSLTHEARFKRISQAYNKLEQHYKMLKFSSIIHHDPSPEKKDDLKKGSTVLQKFIEGFISAKTRQRWQYWMEDVKQILFDYERRVFPLDVEKAITLDVATAAAGSAVKVKTASESFQVKIPPTQKNQIELLIPEKGGKSFVKSKRGDLLLKIRVVPGGVISPGTTNFFYKMEVSKKDIRNGKVLTLNTIQGPIKFFVPSGTIDGKTFVLKAKSLGFPSLRINHVLTLHIG